MRIKSQTIYSFFIGLILSTNSYAGIDGSLTVDYSLIDAIAKAAIREQLNTLNDDLEIAELDSNEFRLLRSLLKRGHHRVHPSYLDSKCAFQPENVLALLDQELSEIDDRVPVSAHSLEDIRRIHGKKMWKALSRYCVNSAKNFEKRLLNKGVSQDQVQELSQFIFYPTWNGRPRLRKALFESLQWTISGAMFLGGSFGLIGIPLGKVILSYALPATSALQLRNLYKNTQGGIHLPQLDIQLDAEELGFHSAAQSF